MAQQLCRLSVGLALAIAVVAPSVLAVSAAVPCNNTLPLLALFNVGLDLTAIQPSQVPNEAVKGRVLDWTCCDAWYAAYTGSDSEERGQAYVGGYNGKRTLRGRY